VTDLPDSLKRIAEFPNSHRDDLGALDMPAESSISFVYECDGEISDDLATLYADGPLPLPRQGEIITLHETKVRVIRVHTMYGTSEQPPRGRARIHTIVSVAPTGAA
jgi:hypothetical protein